MVQPVTKLNIILPGCELEKPVKGKLTWGVAVGFRWYMEGMYLGKDMNFNWNIEDMNLVPGCELYGRWYYNLRKRNNRQKEVKYNASSYLTTGVTVYYNGFDLMNKKNAGEEQISTGLYAGWGIRRRLGRHFIFDAQLKVQPTFRDNSDLRIYFLPDLRVGYLLN